MGKQNEKLSLIKMLLMALILSVTLCNTVKYKLSTLDSPPEDLIWCGKTKDTIIILTENASVFRSTDKGQTWNTLNEIFLTEAKQQNANEINKLGRIVRMHQSPVDPSLIVFLGSEGFSWITENCGTKVSALFQGRPIHQFVFHPTERNWGLASAYSICEDYVNEPCKIIKELFVTKSLGNDWKLIGDYIIQFAWGVKNLEHQKFGIPKERIILTYQPRGKGDQSYNLKRWDYKIDLVYSDDFFETKVVGVRKGNRFLLTNKFLYVAQVIDQETQEAQLLVASCYEKKYDFERVVTNQMSFKEHSYSFLDTSEDSIFLYINNFGESSRYGNIYTSGDFGREFSLSLKNNIQIIDYESDFENVKSVEGVYLANAISGKYIKLARQEMETAERSQSIDNQKQSKYNYMNYVKTLITLNRGGDWKRLKAPGVDSNNKSYECGNYCFLHLHSYSSRLPQFYSVDSAAGLIIGNGNIGRYLDYSYQNMALFLSRDGGVNWYEIRKGEYIYEIGDNGGIIVVALHNQPTKSVLYTFDEGISWEELEISDSPITIKNILIEPNSSTQQFLVYGVKKNAEGEMIGMVILLDYESLQRPLCGKNDYEIWTPTSGKENHQCLLGKKVSYSRRKRNSKCYMGEQFERKVFIEYCECTEDDYQCDVGYHRMEPGDPCTAIRPIGKETTNHPPENCSGYYTISRGYRKIAGNRCVKGAQFDPIKVSCPYNLFWVSLKMLFYFTLFGSIAWLMYIACSSKEFQLIDGITSAISSLKPMFKKIPESYLSIDNIIDEDNTVFENDPISISPPAKEKTSNDIIVNEEDEAIMNSLNENSK